MQSMVLCFVSTLPSYHDSDNPECHQYHINIDNNGTVLSNDMQDHSRWVESCLSQLVLPRVFSVLIHHSIE